MRLLYLKYLVVWIDKKNQCKYQILNLPYEIKSWLRFNNCKQDIHEVKIDYLEEIVGTKILFIYFFLNEFLFTMSLLS